MTTARPARTTWQVMAMDDQDLPPGDDISLAPNYRDNGVWITVGGGPRRLLSPDQARDMADQMEQQFDLDDMDQQGYEASDLVDRLRKLAAQVEPAQPDE